MTLKSIILLICTAFLISMQAMAQEKPKKAKTDYSKSSLFLDKEPLSINIYLNKKKLFRDIGDDRKYHSAIIKFNSEKNELLEIPVKLQTRGNFRRNPENCNMAPLNFKFSEEKTPFNHPFSGQKKLKLVVPCMQNNDRFAEYIIMEYLIYQTFEQISPYYFKTRIVHINLVDSQKLENIQKITGFFIEEDEQMALRYKGIIKEFKKYHPEQVNREQMTFVNVFQYFIANTDWSVEVGHNIKLLFVENVGIPYAIPYDFDWSGLISPPYAVPAPQLNIRTVRERLFRGYIREISEYSSAIQIFNDKKDEIYAIFNQSTYLSEKTKENTLKYMDEFYEVINNPKLIKREFIDKCRK